MTTKKTGKRRISLGPVIGPNARLAACEDEDGEITTTVVQKAREGDNVQDGIELVHVENPDCVCGHWQDVTPLYGSERRATTSGPPQVATEAYREGFDRIFGKAPTVGIA